jgi:predicted membrane protein
LERTATKPFYCDVQQKCDMKRGGFVQVRNKTRNALFYINLYGIPIAGFWFPLLAAALSDLDQQGFHAGSGHRLGTDVVGSDFSTWSTCSVQGDQKFSVHLMITIQKIASNVQSVPRQSSNYY